MIATFKKLNRRKSDSPPHAYPHPHPLPLRRHAAPAPPYYFKPLFLMLQISPFHLLIPGTREVYPKYDYVDLRLYSYVLNYLTTLKIR